MVLIASVLTHQPACRLVCRKVEECTFKVGDLVRKQVQHDRQLELHVLTAPGIVRQVLFRRGYWVCHDKIETREKFEKGDMVCSEFDIKNIGIVQDVDKAGINLSVYWIKDKVITNRPRWHLQPIKKKEKRE